MMHGDKLTVLRMRNLWIAVALIGAASLILGCTKAGDEGKPVQTEKTTEKTEQKTIPTEAEKANQAPAGASSLAEAAGKYKIDPTHAVAIFRVNHLGVSNTYGTFTKMSGNLVLDADPAKSSVSIEIDADSIFTAEKKRDDHLRGPDFLNTSQFPKLTFTSKSIRAVDEKSYEVTGDISLHGVTKPITAKFDHVGSGISLLDKKSFLTGFEGEFTLKRSDFSMNYMPEGIGDDVLVIVSIEAVRQ